VGWSVERYEPALQQTWDDIVRGARARHFLFERAYMAYHRDRFDDASMLLCEDGRPIAALPASRHGDELVSHAGLTFGALLSDQRLTTTRAVDAMGAILARLRAQGVRRWIYKPLPHIYHVVPAEEDLFALFVHGARLIRRDVSVAVGGCARVGYSTERSRATRRGARSPLELGRSDAIEEFMAIQRKLLLQRYGVEPVHTAAEMRLLADRFPDGIKLFAAHDDERAMVAGVVVYETPVVAHVQYIASTERGRDLRAQDALFDHLVQVVYADKRWFDFGTSNERDGSLNRGLVRNKEGFGARAVAYDRYEIELAG
jgi:GNAT acetyltransferase-like protein